jgi:endonuclease/exonuclease/phosphatase family metal-dependent hydrolase
MAIVQLLRLLGFSPRPGAGRRSTQVPPKLEALEDRTLLSHGAGVSVMTYNVYGGTDFTEVLSAQTPQAVPAAISAVWGDVLASDIPQRAEALAKVIATSHPDLAGLQEVTEWTVNGQVKFDILDSLLKDLQQLGEGYHVVIAAPDFAAQAPDTAGELIGVQDENVILARNDVSARQMSLSNAQEAVFSTHIDFPLGGAGGPVFVIARSWASVDVTSHGSTFRFITTHLEPNSAAVNVAQANELLSGPADTTLPVVMAGDFNSPADGTGTAYNNIVAAGFTDVWSQEHPDNLGYTAGDSGPVGIASPTRLVDQRIDFIFTHGGVHADNERLVGTKPDDRTPSGLWPSDHNGVVATIHLPRHLNTDHNGVVGNIRLPRHLNTVWDFDAQRVADVLFQSDPSTRHQPTAWDFD